MEQQKRSELLNNILYATKSISDFQNNIIGGIDYSNWTKKDCEFEHQGGYYYYSYNIPSKSKSGYYKLKIQKRAGFFSFLLPWLSDYVLYFERVDSAGYVDGESLIFYTALDRESKKILKDIWNMFENRNNFKIEEAKNANLTSFNEDIKNSIDKKFVRDDKLDALLDHK